MTETANTPRLIVDKANELDPAGAPGRDDIARITPDPVDQPAVSKPKSARGPALVRAILQVFLAVAVLFAAQTGMKRLIATKPEGTKRPAREQVYTVQMMPVQLADYQPTFTVYGNTIAGDSVDLRALVSGEITAVHPNLSAGATVTAGEVLVEVDRFEYEGALTEAKANLQEANARLAEINAKIDYERAALGRTREQLALAERDLQRSNDLLGRGSGTQKSVDDKQMSVFERAQSLEQRQSNLAIDQARADQQRATIRRLDWKVTQAERDLENTRLKAPFDGVISSEAAGIGRNISANDVVVSLYGSDSLEVRFVATDAQYGRLLSDPDGVIGRTVQVIWGVGGEPAVYNGRIERVGAELKSDRGGVELLASVDLETSSTELRPGAFVEVIVPDKVYRSTVRLPETAIYNGNRIYVIEEDRLVARTVTVATYTGGYAIVSDGLKAGEAVLTTQIADARDGLKVVAEGAEPKQRGSGGKSSDKSGGSGEPARRGSSEDGKAGARPAKRS